MAACDASTRPKRLAAPPASPAPVVPGQAPQIDEASAPAKAREAVDAAAFDALARSMRPTGGEALLLLGVHLEPIEGYGPIFSSEGVPNTDTKPGYRTLLLRTKDGGAELVGELPYLALPRRRGFRFFGESSVRIHGAQASDESEAARFYDATALWSTTVRRAVPAVARGLEARLRAGRRDGVEDTVQIVYVTPSALCTTRTSVTWTGGALAFLGETAHRLAPLDGAAFDRRLSRHLDGEGLGRLARGLLERREELTVPDRAEGGEIDLDVPLEGPWGQSIDVREDVGVCLERGAAFVALTGTAMRSGNSARRFSESLPVGPAPASLAPSNAVAIDFGAVRAAFADATDAFASPGGDVVLVLRASAEGGEGAANAGGAQAAVLSTFDALRRRQGPDLALPGRVVMAEWARGEAAARWQKALLP